MGPMIVDDAGQLVWFRPVTGGRVAMDVRTQSYAGKPVLTWWEGRLFGGGGRGVGMVLDERYKTVKRVQMGNGFAADLARVHDHPAGHRADERLGRRSSGPRAGLLQSVSGDRHRHRARAVRVAQRRQHRRARPTASAEGDATGTTCT